jgi:cytochrome P450
MHNLSSTRDEGIHARLRRAVSGAYAMTNVLDYEPLMDRTSDEFFRILTERFVETGDVCPLAEWLQYFAFDVLLV